MQWNDTKIISVWLDVQELKRTSMQIEARLTGLYHNLDRYVGNMRMDVKTYVDNLYKNNQLQG